MEGGNFNILNTEKPTNKDLIVVFSPAQNTKSYTYIVFKDDEQFYTATINSANDVRINLNETGVYKIDVKVKDATGEHVIHSGEYVIDKEAPVLKFKENNLTLRQNEDFPSNYVTASDTISGDLTNQIQSNIDEVNLKQLGEKTITYKVSDEAGNIAEANLNVNVTNNAYFLYGMQLLAFVLIIGIALLITRFVKSVHLMNRIDPFTLSSVKTKEPSLSDRIVSWYQNMLRKQEDKFTKSIFAQKYSKHLEKYAEISFIHTNGMQIFISKIIMAVLFLIIGIFARAIQFRLISPYEIFLPMTVGFFLLDIVYFIKFKTYRKKLENDLLSAIIVMNNAFKSGRSIVQAIDIVSHELNGRMAREFSKMSLELSYGLEIDTVFKRFAKRVKLDEVNYLTASLTILNKTGGNIVEVFTSIEKTMFNKKTLRLELKSLTASSRIIVYVLFIVPFLFVLFISIISPSYFLPFVTTGIGRILLGIMLVYYLIFIYVVRRVMKVVI